MKKLKIKACKQKYEKSCWACCSRMVYNFYSGKEVYSNDNELAKAAGLSVTDFQNIQTALEKLKIYGGQDGSANIPKLKEIKASIDEDQPLIVCLTSKSVKFEEDVKGGHYVVISGYDLLNKKLHIVDPHIGIPEWVEFDEKECKLTAYTMYWGVTYYTEEP